MVGGAAVGFSQFSGLSPYASGKTLGADILAWGLTTPEAIAANMIDPATPDQDELLHAIRTLAAVRKAARH